MATQQKPGPESAGQPSSHASASRIYNQQLTNGDSKEVAAHASKGAPLSPKNQEKKPKSALRQACAWIVDQQLSISILFTTAVVTAHNVFPSWRWETDKFLHLQYQHADSGMYSKGWDDMFFVLQWIMIFCGLRVAFMEYLAAPFAKWAQIKGRKEHVRFAEQAWVLLYDSTMWSLGFYIIYHSDYWRNMDAMWHGWPIRKLDGLMKWYYLVQFAFWLQQIVVVHIEERRKDHWEMFTHHIVTCTLLFFSYAYHQTRVGNVILCLMDFVDILLPLAKILRYLGLQFACDCVFGVFILGWIITRHVLYNMVVWSLWARFKVFVEYGCYTGEGDNMVGPTDPPDGFWHIFEPIKDPMGLVCWTESVTNGFLALLIGLQIILCIWMSLILRLAFKVLRGQSAEDPRSDDEEEELEEVDARSKKTDGKMNEKPLEEEVGAEQLSFRSQRPSNSSRTSAVQIPVKKELLNRVGCDTKTSK